MLAGDTEEEMRAAAQAALEWYEANRPTNPPTSAVSASIVTAADRIELPGQMMSRDALARMLPSERMTAARQGRLMQLGVGIPNDVKRSTGH
jgi:hypothetical protein